MPNCFLGRARRSGNVYVLSSLSSSQDPFGGGDTSQSGEWSASQGSQPRVVGGGGVPASLTLSQRVLVPSLYFVQRYLLEGHWRKEKGQKQVFEYNSAQMPQIACVAINLLYPLL